MKTSFYTLFLLALAGGIYHTASAIDISATLPTAAGDRSYIIHAPGSAVAQNLPVVFVLHGDGGTGASIKGYSGFDALADTEQFMAVYPSAQSGSWSRAKGELKDVEFISALIDYLCGEYKVNTAKVYATGHSAGGYMAYNLGMSLPGKITAIAPVAGNMYGIDGFNWNNFFSSADFRPLPVMHIHGDADATVTYPDPNHTPDSWSEWPLSSLAYFTCGENTYTLPQQDLNPSGSVRKLSFCSGAVELSLVRIVGGGHGWPNQPGWNTTAAIWDFFDNYALDGTQQCDALPVSLSRFEVAPADDSRSVRVDWETGTEHDFSHFELERSKETSLTDAGHFELIALLPGHSREGGPPHSYRWLDTTAAAGVNYYRLKMIDEDGSAAFSEIKSVLVPETGSAGFEVRPVPANGSFFLAADHEKFPAEISVTDTRGVVIFTKTIKAAGEPVSTDALQPGLYFVRMKGYAPAQRILVVH